MSENTEGRMIGLENEGLRRGHLEGGLASHQDVGEDAGFFSPGLSVVCDGVGGLEGGEAASHIVLDTICRKFGHASADRTKNLELPALQKEEAERKVLVAILNAESSISEARIFYAHDMPHYKVGATTAVVNFFYHDREGKTRMCVGGVGDSGSFLFRQDTLQRLIPEDSFIRSLEEYFGISIDINEQTINMLVPDIVLQALNKKNKRKEDLTPQEVSFLDSLQNDSLRSLRRDITTYLGEEKTLEPSKVHVNDMEVEPGDLIISCTDGITDNTTMALFKDKIRWLITQGYRADKMAEELKDWAIQLQTDPNNPFIHGTDDITIVVQEYVKNSPPS